MPSGEVLDGLVMLSQLVGGPAMCAVAFFAWRLERRVFRLEIEVFRERA